MTARKAKALPFAEAVAKLAKQPVKELAEALSKLVAQRQTQPIRRPAYTPPAPRAVPPKPATTRRGARRVGFKRYTATTKYDASRAGTFRKYMIATIRAYTDTVAAARAHDACDNAKFAKNKLDFNWAADNGYITFN